MPFTVSWSIEGEQQLARRMRGIETQLRDFRKPLEGIAKNLKKFFSTDVFQTRGSAIGEPWAPLSPVTIARKARQGYPTAPLVRTGAMKAGFRSLVSAEQAVIANTQGYFKYHQSNKPRTKLPRRVMMKLGELQKQMIVKEFQKYIREMKNKNG